MGKRFFDISCSLFLLAALSPLLLVIVCLVGITSSGPIIYRQSRVGRLGVPFTILKFRTMTDKSGSGKLSDLVTKADDPRITKVGRFLRSTHLDELPQLWNVVLGEMSLIGPRPVSVEIATIRETEIRGYRKRFEVLPGITGLVQTRKRYRRAKTNLRRCLLLDIFYIERQCFAIDLLILLRTVAAVWKKQGI